MLNEVKNWIAETLAGEYKYFFGTWVETQADANISYCVIQAAGGPAVDVDDRRPRFKVILLGKRNGGDGNKIYSDAQSLMLASVLNDPPCGCANITATTEPIGPAFTTENRAFVQLGFQLIF